MTMESDFTVGRSAAITVVVGGSLVTAFASVFACCCLFSNFTHRNMIPSRVWTLTMVALALLGWGANGLVQGLYWIQLPAIISPIDSIMEPILSFLLVPLRVVALLVVLLRLVVSYHSLPTIFECPPHWNPSESPRVYRLGPSWLATAGLVAMFPFIGLFTGYLIFYQGMIESEASLLEQRPQFHGLLGIFQGLYGIVGLVLTLALLQVADSIRGFDNHTIRISGVSLLGLMLHLTITGVLDYARDYWSPGEPILELESATRMAAVTHATLYFFMASINTVMLIVLYNMAMLEEVETTLDGPKKRSSHMHIHMPSHEGSLSRLPLPSPNKVQQVNIVPSMTEDLNLHPVYKPEVVNDSKDLFGRQRTSFSKKGRSSWDGHHTFTTIVIESNEHDSDDAQIVKL